MTAGGHGLDGIKLLFLKKNDGTDAETWAELVILADAARTATGYPRKCYTIKLSSGKPGKNCYIELFIWGEPADWFAQMMPEAWWERNRRCDHKRLLPARKKGEMRKFADTAKRRGAKGIGVNAIDKPRGYKSDKRESGGDGLSYGSRKSNRHAVVLQRGNELPYYEFRVANDQWAPILRMAQRLWNSRNNKDMSLYDCVKVTMAVEASYWWANNVSEQPVENYVQDCIDEAEEVDDFLAVAARKARRDAADRDYWDTLADRAEDVIDAFELVPASSSGRTR